MVTITVPDKYAEALHALGAIQPAIDQAIQRYTIEQIADKIAQLRRREHVFETKYGMNYAAFVERMAHDEAFVRTLETESEPLWEMDLSEWEFCIKGIEDWTHTLQTILLT